MQTKPGETSDKLPPEGLIKLAARLYNQPLLIDRARLDALLAVMRLDQELVTPEAFFFFFEEPETEEFITRDGIAWIQIHRSMLRGRTYTRIRKQLDAALASQNVRGILLDIDSPGGEVAGLFDLVDFIFESREVKPIWALANDDALSAAYAIATGAERIAVTRTGGIGSVGVIAVHVEFSAMDERIGVKSTPIFSGERKADFIDSEPLNDTARQLLQDEVDRLRVLFVETVARNRGVSADEITETEAGVFFGPSGVPLLADVVENVEQVFEGFRGFIESGAFAASAKKHEEKAMAEKQKTDAKKETPEATPAKEKTKQADVVDIATARSEARKEGAAEGREEAATRTAAIRQLCDISGCPDRFGEFLDSDLSPDQVGKKILEERADDSGPEVRGQHGASNGSDSVPVIDTAKVYQSRRMFPTG